MDDSNKIQKESRACCYEEPPSSFRGPFSGSLRFSAFPLLPSFGIAPRKRSILLNAEKGSLRVSPAPPGQKRKP